MAARVRVCEGSCDMHVQSHDSLRITTSLSSSLLNSQQDVSLLLRTLNAHICSQCDQFHQKSQKIIRVLDFTHSYV